MRDRLYREIPRSRRNWTTFFGATGEKASGRLAGSARRGDNSQPGRPPRLVVVDDAPMDGSAPSAQVVRCLVRSRLAMEGTATAAGPDDKEKGPGSIWPGAFSHS